VAKVISYPVTKSPKPMTPTDTSAKAMKKDLERPSNCRSEKFMHFEIETCFLDDHAMSAQFRQGAKDDHNALRFSRSSLRLFRRREYWP
jgi:hypothetical protein